jgi:hypothetical protein
LVATYPGAGISVTVSQNNKAKDRLEISSQMMFGEYVEKLGALSRQQREDVLWDLRFSLVMSNLIFAIIPPENPQSVVVMDHIWYDGLTKDRFMSSVHRVAEGALLVSWKLIHRFGLLRPQTAAGS